MGLFDKKFKVKVNHFSGKYYTVKYAHYRIIPFYHNICRWLDYSYNSGLECWNPILLSFSKAESFAKDFKTYNDVVEYYKADEKKEKQFYINQKKWRNDNIPYSSKQIK